MAAKAQRRWWVMLMPNDDEPRAMAHDPTERGAEAIAQREAERRGWDVIRDRDGDFIVMEPGDE